MRADRLISIIMLLQIHERMTAAELSAELEVSVRTIYRDIIALSTAGVPIFTDRGPGGGIRLLENYRTTLTGLQEEELRALFMMNIPQALVDLGVGSNLKNALLKLAASLPARQQQVQYESQQRIYLDSTAWQPASEPAPHLATLHTAIWQDLKVRLVFRGSFDTYIDLMLEPLGLVAKLNVWYLVGRADEHLRVLKIADIVEVEAMADKFNRDARFNLATFWSEWCAGSLDRRPQYKVRLRMAPGLISKMKYYLDETDSYSVAETDQPDSNDWKIVDIIYENFFQARQSILNFGRAAEVLEPEPLRLSVLDFAQQIVEFYQSMT